MPRLQRLKPSTAATERSTDELRSRTLKKAASALLVYVALCFAIAALAGCAVGERGAVQAQGTDVLSTVTGLSLGAVEANPLGLS